MEETFFFDKSFHERVQEYRDIIGMGLCSFKNFQSIWPNYLEENLDPNGWQAIWKIPRIICEKNQVEYPCIALVYVEYIDFIELKARVIILAIQNEDCSWPNETQVVNLFELMPTKDQDVTLGLTINTTANAIDVLNFFYENILYPWDNTYSSYSHDEEFDLESRIRLYFNMRNGIISTEITNQLMCFLSEGKRLKAKLDLLKNYENNHLEISYVPETFEVRLLKIRNEFFSLNCSLDMLEKGNGEMKTNEKMVVVDNKTHINCLICPEGTACQFLLFLNEMRKRFDNCNLEICRNLNICMETTFVKDNISFCPGRHEIKSSSKLLSHLQGSLRMLGMDEKNGDKTILFSKYDDVLLDCNTESLLIENLTIDGQFSQYAVVVRKGTVVIKNCNIVGNFKSSTQKGILVLKSANLLLENCRISGFNAAIVGYKYSNIQLKNCFIHSVYYGLKIFEGSKINVKSSKFENCFNYGICMEIENKEFGKISGDFSILKSIPDMIVDDLSATQINKAEAIIREKPDYKRLKPIQNLFSSFNSKLSY